MTDYKNELRSVLYDFLGDFKEKRYLSEGNTDEAIAKLEALLSQHSKKRELEALESLKKNPVVAIEIEGHRQILEAPMLFVSDIDDRINQLGGQDE